MRGALGAVEPATLLSAVRARSTVLPVDPLQPLFVVAAGKAAGPMTDAFLDLWSPRDVRGVGTGPAPHSSAAGGFAWHDGGHPAPNAASVAAARDALAMARVSDGRGPLVVLLSGGASAMLAAPADGVTLDDKISVGAALMRAGVAIDGLNCVRKHLSAIKGGRLAAAARRSVTLAISDVHGPMADDPSIIGSGPTVADPTTFADAAQIVAAAGIDVPPAVRTRLERGRRGEVAETIKPGDAALDDARYAVVGSRADAVAGARRAAEAHGYTVIEIDEPTSGESRTAAGRFLDRAFALAGSTRPACVLAAGETTVRVTGTGTGGRNQEFALSQAARLRAAGPGVVLASLGTDGIDGPTDAAGGLADATTVARAEAQHLDLDRVLANNDTYTALQSLGDLIVTGPTGTNVGDLQVLLLG